MLVEHRNAYSSPWQDSSKSLYVFNSWIDSWIWFPTEYLICIIDRLWEVDQIYKIEIFSEIKFCFSNLWTDVSFITLRIKILYLSSTYKSECRCHVQNARKYSPWLRICIAIGDAYMAWEGQHHLLSQIDQSTTQQLRSQARCPRWWKTLKMRIPTSLRRLVSMNNICYAAMFYRAFSDNTPLSRMFTMWNSVAQ